jgi:excisionase family DNA binding protein
MQATTVLIVEVRFMLTAREVAKMFGVHPATIYKLAERGEIEHVRIGDAVRFPPEAVEAFRRRVTRPARVAAAGSENARS